MISNQHYIEIYVEGNLLELKSQDSLNLRMNNVLFNPTKTTTNMAEFSYSFEIPSTPNNNKIFGYANVLAKTNKFHNRYAAEVYADGTLLFKGSLTIRKYDAKEKVYECNLVNIKVNTLDDIFGDAIMPEVGNWKVDYDGGSTIREVNRDYSTKYYFPFVCYGCFEKTPYSNDTVGARYTPKHTLDKYNKWFHTSFQPSLNMIETMKKCFEWKGYTVGGTALSDPLLNYIYMSTNMADGQVMKYNLGNPKLGKLTIFTSWTTESATRDNIQDLNFPYERIRPAMNASNRDAGTQYNFSTIRWYNMLSSKEGATSVRLGNNSYLYDGEDSIIVIPQDGWYKIYLNFYASLDRTVSEFTCKQWTTTYNDGDAFEKRDVVIDKGLKNLTPFEIQLIRNYKANENTIELIKGKWNIEYATGYPRQEYYTIQGGSYTASTTPNATIWTTSFPHEDNCGVTAPTKQDSITSQAVAINSSGGTSSGGEVFNRGRRSGSFGNGDYMDTNQGGKTNLTTKMIGYVYNDGATMPYDPVVSDTFICGFTSRGGGCPSVMRNGGSWSRQCSTKNQIMSNVDALPLVYTDGTVSATSYSYNEYPRASNNYIYTTDNIMNGYLYCLVKLNRNDVLQLVGVLRDYDLVGGNTHSNPYDITATVSMEIEAISERTEEQLRADPNFGYTSGSEWESQLNLFNFTNKETKVKDWIENVAKAFNLEITQEGNYISVDTKQGIKKNISYTVDIDDRVSNDEVESEYISYPREMAVKYNIDTDEYGFELTVPQEHINDVDWKQWGDSGYTIIKLSDDAYETSTQTTQTQFSYTYYDNFLWKEVLQDGTEREEYSGATIQIPTIEKSEFMAEGYNYEDAMVHDGFSQPQRFWYRDQPSQMYVYTSDVFHDNIELCLPMNAWEGFNLSYKDTEKSILTEYFNINPMLSSNYVNVDVYLTPQEYTNIKRGAMIHFDSDLYYVSEISGYDPSGNNKTTLKLIKKV